MAGDKRFHVERDVYGFPQRIELFGKDASFWGEVDHVLDAHGIKTAKELNDKLGAVKYPRIKVMDSGNSKRLLGTLPRPDVEPRGPRLMMAVHDPVLWRDEFRMATICEAKVRTIEFAVTELRKGWDIELVLTTSALLSELLRLPEFRLPGETASQAKRRWEMHTFG